MTAGDVPVEGYYAEDERLTEYFRLVRALQRVDGRATPAVESLVEFQRLLEVVSAPLFGVPQFHGRLLPTGRDALSRALIERSPTWTLEGLVSSAHRAALESDEISLVGLAARVKDPVVLAAARESVVLYAEMITGCFPMSEPKVVWKVEQDLVRQAGRFVEAFNALFGENLPAPAPKSAECYGDACEDNEIVGRCVRLGKDDAEMPPRVYHWAICRNVQGEPRVQEFWDSEVWTTARYRAALQGGGLPPDF